MKKLLVLFLAVSMATFTSCKKDDDKIETEKPTKETEVEETTNSIIGKWKIVLNKKPQSITNSGKSEEAQKCNNKSYIEFTATITKPYGFSYDETTKTCKAFEGDASKYTIDGDKIKFTGKNKDGEEEEETTKFKVSGDTLTTYQTDGEGNEIKVLYKRM